MTEAGQRDTERVRHGLAPEARQRQASDPAASVWVGASAGSGKTTVLTDRVMRLLLDGVKPQKILCLTFTRAGAAEMAIRITNRLSLWATCSEETLDRDLEALQDRPPTKEQRLEARRLFARVLSCPGGMRIRTIHAFCQEILGRFPIEAGLPPHFAVIDEGDAAALEEAVFADLLRAVAQTPDSPAAKALGTLLHGVGENRFMLAMRDVVRARAKLNEAMAAAGGFDALIEALRAFLSLKPGESEDRLILEAVSPPALPEASLRQAALWLHEGSKTFAERGENILAWLALPPTERASVFGNYLESFFTGKGEPFKKVADKATLQAHPEIETIMREEEQRLLAARARIETAQVADITEAVLRFGSALNDGYAARKSLQAALDYDDLIIRTNELLHRSGVAPWVLYKLDGGLDHILVDEAQDTSRAQWSIVEALTDEFFTGAEADGPLRRTLFAVGDEKQSIFSFQDAEPEAFTEKREYFTQRLRDIEQELRLVGLNMSFRSAPAVLRAVDLVFSDPRAQAGVSAQTIQHEPVPPRPGEPAKIGRVEVWPLSAHLETLAADDDPADWPLPIGYAEEHDPQAELAATIARKIGGWIKDQEVLPGTNRRIAPGDIMILLRNRGRFADLMVRALKKEDVPVTGVDRMKLTQQLPVMDLLALIQFALLPEDDLNLANILRGPMLNLTEEQLMAAAAGRGALSLWSSLLKHAKSEVAFETATAYLGRLLGEADFVTPFAFLARILNEPCPGSPVSGRRALWARLGLDALDPIDELLNAAQDFSLRHAPSLEIFLHRIRATERTIKREMDQRGGQVRIMTIHGAKGLEAPIVFLPDTTGVPRLQDIPKLAWSGDDIPLYLARRPTGGTALRLWTDGRRKQLEEYRRLLYVALTRAARCLFICGWSPSRSESNAGECWYNLIRDGLRQHHEPASIQAGVPVPEIALADELCSAPEDAAPAPKAAPGLILPGWALQPAEDERDVLRPLAASQNKLRASATPDRAFSRGRIIHRLLQSLPEVEDSRREAIATRFLGNVQHQLTDEQQKDIQREVMRLLRHPDYAPLFGPHSRAEVPLAGLVAGQPMTGQVDRLCLLPHEVWVVDYKTNRPPPAIVLDVPAEYSQQLANYRAILRGIYPDRTLRCFLLWTHGPRLMELPEPVLAR
ncbi:MAG: double-strand break repair helicase AddA [Pseudomonadota bacterium]|nr:double-strand break repair helicase AddA [Pseudomonadota bacterium]